MNIHLSDDIRVCLAAFCVIAGLTAFVQMAMRFLSLPDFTARKILHAGAISTCGIVVAMVSDQQMLSAVFFVFFLVLWIVARKKILFRQDETSYGIAFFALAFSLLLAVGITTKAIVFGAMVTAFCDPVAGWIGRRFEKNPTVFLFEKKSWPGFLGFYIGCLGVSVCFVGWHPLVLLLAAVPAIGELYSWRGSDNLMVPLLSSIWYQVLESRTPDWESPMFVGLLCVASVVILRRRWLTPQALPAALLLALILFFAASWQWVAVLSVFFVGGSLSSRLVPAAGDATGRNARQVFANGGIAACCAVGYFLTKDTAWVFAFLTSVASSMADTLSSDLGIRGGQQPIDIIYRKPLQKGMSGGITLLGTLAGLGGAILLASMGGLLFPISIWQVFVVAVLGFLGMVADSVIGSLWQAKYRDVSGTMSESEGKGKILIHGIPAITNDAVNFLANALVTATAFLVALH